MATATLDKLMRVATLLKKEEFVCESIASVHLREAPNNKMCPSVSNLVFN